jgi:putative heme-binding domain-containing protein
MNINRSSLARFSLRLWIFFTAISLRAETPRWIWHDNHGAKPADGEVRFFRKTFALKGNIEKAVLACAADDELRIYINGREVMEAKGCAHATYADVTKDLKPGENVIAIRGTNDSGPAAIMAKLDITITKWQSETMVTDRDWVSSTNTAKGWMQAGFSEAGWTKAVSLGKVGVQPWGNPLAPRQATPAKQLTVAPGFKVELLRSAQPWEGSWICMTIDAKGRLIISPQQGKGNLLRVTLTRRGKVDKVETIDQPVGGAMGLLYAFDSLYLNGDGPEGRGLYRLHYNPQTDRFDSVELLKLIENSGGEHGSHAIVLGPDQHLYIVSGNFTHVPSFISPESPHKNYAEDQLLPRAEDGNGFGIGVKPPGGFLLRTDKDGKEWELVCAGMRNTYDVAFNTDGELFGFDSDMEWDWGLPWYRPIRFCHLVSGGDYGFREGSGKWPKYYPDSLPSAADVGIGSPTGLKFGTDSKFPDKYKKALFALDWTYGRIFAAYFTPHGATYDASFETILKGKPLNLTDLEFGKDGAMYFITGGRGIQSGLYRLSYTGRKLKPETNGPTSEVLATAAKARELRHELEAFHGKENSNAVDFAWPHLASDDRWIRYAARIAIESQPVAQWQDRALAETNANAALTALLALARCGSNDTQLPLLRALAQFPPAQLDEEQRLAKLRVIELSLIRQGRPKAEVSEVLSERLDSYYPSRNEWINRELSQLLIYLEAPDVVEKTLALLDAAPTQEEQIHYILHLRTLEKGWTLAQREHYFKWFNQLKVEEEKGPEPKHPPELLKWFADAGRDYSDGASFPKFIASFKRNAEETLTDDERTALGPILGDNKPEAAKVPAVQRKFVSDWKMSDLEPLLGQVTKGRSFATGKEVFTAAQCIVCHRFGKDGGSVGPELTAVSSRYGHRDILESIIEPSKVISEQYINTTIIKKDGDDVTGRVVAEDDKKLTVVVNPLDQTKVEVLKSEIQSRTPSKVSPMPQGLVNNFTQDEILDLIAYMESSGKESAAAFEKK